MATFTRSFFSFGSLWRSIDFVRAGEQTVALGAVGVFLITTTLACGCSPTAKGIPELELASLSQGIVKRGEMVRQVRGPGILAAQDRRHLPAPHSGRVEQVYLFPGASVLAKSVLVQLINTDLEEQAREAELNLQSAEADLVRMRAEIRSQQVIQDLDLAELESQYRDAKLKNNRDQALFREGLIRQMDYELSTNAVADFATRIRFQKDKTKMTLESLDAQLASKTSLAQGLREALASKRAQLNELTVRAGTAGILEQVLVQVGQEVTEGTDLAVVVEPTKLRATLVIPEMQALDIREGQKAEVDTETGLAYGRVKRIEPSAVNGTRTVDIALDGAPPPGAVPNSSIDGTVEIERLQNVLYMTRPAVQQNSTEVSIFRISRDGKEAKRVRVRLGRSALSKVEVLQGLNEGDRVILSDMSAFNSDDRIRLK